MIRTYGLWLLGVPLLVACGPESEETVSGSALALTAQDNVEQALIGVYDAAAFVADSAALAEILGPLAGGSDCDAAPLAPPQCPVGQTCPPPAEPECPTAEVTVEDLQENRNEAREVIDDVVEVLREKIFIAENLESEDASSATYLLGPNTLCGDDESIEPAPAPGVTPQPPGPDPDCVEQAQRLQVRLRLTQPDAGDVNVELLMTAAKHNPATLELHDDHVALVVNLGEIMETLNTLGEDTGQLTAMTGTTSVEILRYGALDYGLRTSVREAIHVAALDDGGQPIDYRLGESVPLFELRLDGNQKQLTGSYDLGTMNLSAPFDFFRSDSVEYDVNGMQVPQTPYTGMIEAFLAGIEGSVTLDGNNDELALTNLGLGDASSWVKHDGTIIAQVDVNPDAGRHFDLKAKKMGEDQVALTFSPTFDASLLLNLASIAAQLEDDVPAYALNDTLRVFFDGAEPTVQTEPDALRVVSGTLNLTSASVPSANLLVPTGSCLVQSDGLTPAAHELLGEFAVGACP